MPVDVRGQLNRTIPDVELSMIVHTLGIANPRRGLKGSGNPESGIRHRRSKFSESAWSESSASLAVDEESALSGLVEFGEEDPLPLTEKHLTIDNRDRHRRLARDELPDVRVTVDELIFLEVLRPHIVVIVLVVDVARNNAFDGPTEVVEETCLGFVDEYGGRRVG